MKHHKSGRVLSREKDQRNALLNGLISSLIIHEKIKTTCAKAKETAPLAEKMITRAKKGDLSAIKRMNETLSKEAALKIMKIAESKFQSRNGGYTRIIKLAPRKIDGAEMAVLELIHE